MARNTAKKEVKATKVQSVEQTPDENQQAAVETPTYKAGDKVKIAPTEAGSVHMRKPEYTVDGLMANTLIAKGFAVAID